METQEPREDATEVISTGEDEVAEFYANPPDGLIMPSSKFLKQYLAFMKCKQEARTLQGELARAEKALPIQRESAGASLAKVVAYHEELIETARNECASVIAGLEKDVEDLRNAHKKANKASKHKVEGLDELLASDMRNM